MGTLWGEVWGLRMHRSGLGLRVSEVGACKLPRRILGFVFILLLEFRV